MSHHIHAFVARRSLLDAALPSLGELAAVALTQGFALLPVTERLAGPDGPLPFPPLRRLTATLAAWAAEASRGGAIAYLETEYFGGVGTQAAVAWRDGELAFGPVESETRWVNGSVEDTPPDRAINRALRVLGVERGHAVDEFDALGLGRHRSDAAWLSGRA